MVCVWFEIVLFDGCGGAVGFCANNKRELCLCISNKNEVLNSNELKRVVVSQTTIAVDNHNGSFIQFAWNVHCA